MRMIGLGNRGCNKMCNQGGIKKVGKCQITKRQTVANGGANAVNDDDGHQWYFCDTLKIHFCQCKHILANVSPKSAFFGNRIPSCAKPLLRIA